MSEQVPGRIRRQMMQDGGVQAGSRPFSVETVRGAPYRIAGRTLVPVTRIVSLGRARGTVGTRRVGGWSWGLVWVTPLAVVEQTAGGERQIAIPDGTAHTLWGTMGVALAITLFFTAARRLMCRRQRGG